MTLPWDTATAEEVMEDIRDFKNKAYEAGSSDQFDVLLDDCVHGEYEEVECGIEHPNLGNPCILDYDHKDLHEDLTGNEWYGRP